ncbi:hypothetical protein PPROV_000855800 [Pycnococcus provasolii]|uniref:J domain-containing protein n=1 Tax=Pycnococcus provasolii TaxID=41880 RepID=A0A830HT35_9CHLO|nr:hypothetical protein PPROV_000855800 [Pycnococcus provasolii]
MHSTPRRYHSSVITVVYHTMSLTLLDDNLSVAERNEEINRRRHARSGGNHVARVIDPDAFRRFMEEAAREAAKAKAKEDEREAERRRREGSNYRTPEQRKKDAEAAKAELEASGEARRIVDRFDPDVDYYKLLQLDRACSTEEIRRAFRKHALAYHPDKAPPNASDEQRTFMREQFQKLQVAHDVLVDDAMRALYDKTRDHIETHGPGSRPVLSAEEQRLMSRGAGEMSRLRRAKQKTVKPPTITAEVQLSLEEMHDGVTITVEKNRQQVDSTGQSYEERKQFHLVVRKGAVDGQCLDFPGEGNEYVDTLPGDASFTLRSARHAYFKRRGTRDLEVRLTAWPSSAHGECAEDVLCWRDAVVLSRSASFQADSQASGGAAFRAPSFRDGGADGGSKHARRAVFNVLAGGLRRGGCGGVDEMAIVGEGMPDPADAANVSLRGAMMLMLRCAPPSENRRWTLAPQAKDVLDTAPVATIASSHDNPPVHVPAEEKTYINPELAAEEKAKGNECFKGANYPAAVEHYTEALKRLGPDGEGRHLIYSNRAACYTKMFSLNEALKDADLCIEIAPDFVKGYSRKAAAEFFLKDYDDALASYQNGLDIDVSNEECKDGVRRCVEHINKANRGELSEEEICSMQERAMAKPEVQNILSDPEMRQVLDDMQQEDPKAAQTHVQDPGVAAKIQKLVNSGIIQVR